MTALIDRIIIFLLSIFLIISPFFTALHSSRSATASSQSVHQSVPRINFFIFRILIFCLEFRNISIKFFIENIRIKREHKSGIIWWNLLDGWPQMSDAIVDYYFEKKIAYDYIKRSQQPFTIMCSELKNWGTTVVASNDSLNTVCGNYRVTDVMSDKVVLEGDFSVEKNSNYELGFVRLMFSVQGMYLIEWWIDGRRYINHYTYGMPKFELEEYRKWFEKIK